MDNRSLPLAARYLVWLVMDNHYHLLIETPEANLSKGMRQLNGVYTQSFNYAQNRVGHVFQGRYKAILVDKDNYLLELARYIVLNPVRARMVRSAREWPWSSYRATVGQQPKPGWLNTEWLLAGLPGESLKQLMLTNGSLVRVKASHRRGNS